MGWTARLPRGVLLLICLLITSLPVSARQSAPPEWYRLSAALGAPPALERPVEVLATVSCRFGELRQVEVALSLPPGWTCGSSTQRLEQLASGGSRLFRFSVQPGGPLSNGSIGCRFSALSPRTAIADWLRKQGAEGAEMAGTVLSWPERGSGFTDIPFALFPDEGFYPLGPDMWLDYDDRLKPEGVTRGPSLYKESVISGHQAATDVEMYQRLVAQMAANPALGESLKNGGIDLDRKRQDVLSGLYVLAQEAFAKGTWSEAESWLGRFETLGREIPGDRLPELRIAAGNLRALVLWSKGDRKEAEKVLRQTFYVRRKSPAQRYVLRNLALLALQRGDKAAARESFRLALEFKPGWSLVTRELKSVTK